MKKIKQFTLLSFAIFLSLFSCTENKHKSGELQFGENNIFKLSPSQSEVVIDSLDIALNYAIHGEGRVQFPLNRMTKDSEGNKMFLNIAVPSDNMGLILKQTEGTSNIVLKKNDAYLIKVDTSYVVRKFYQCKDEKFIYEFNYISTDSIKMTSLIDSISTIVDDKIICQ